MKISYLITCANETDTLDKLLYRVFSFLSEDDEVIVLQDTKHYNIESETNKILSKYSKSEFTHVCHELNNNYGEHKNWGMSRCTGKFIFQIDGDENPSEDLLVNIKDIIEANPGTELFYIPRINDFVGVTEEHAKQWGWKLTTSKTKNRPMVNFPDYQGRLFLKEPGRIKWIGKLHERIEGNKNYAYLPPNEDLALYHDKTIETQISTNLRYNREFSVKENQGFILPK